MSNMLSRYDLFSNRINDEETEKKVNEYFGTVYSSAEESMLLHGGLFDFEPNRMSSLVHKRIIPRMDLVLTTKCTLKCEKCANLMQYYDNPYDVDYDVIIKSMDALLKVVDYIGEVYVLGGEPFVYKYLSEVIKYLSTKEKVGVIKVVTNGTVSPLSIRWDYFMVPNLIVTVSYYGEKSRKIYDIIAKMRSEHINYYVMKIKYFLDTGDLRKRNRKPEEIKKVFSDCGTLCKSLFNGKLYICPRAAHGMDLGLIPSSDHDCLDLLDDRDVNDRLNAFFNQRTFVSCDYCDIRTEGYYDRKCPPAEQQIRSKNS